MTSAPNSRRRALTAGLASSLWLAACGGGGGGGSGGSSNVRALNLTTDVPNLDLYTGDTKQFSAVQQYTASSSVTIDANSYTLYLRDAGTTPIIYTSPSTYSLAKDQSYAAVVWGRRDSLRISTLTETEDASTITASSTARIRLFPAVIDSGPVDVHFTNATGDFTSTSRLFTGSNVTLGLPTGYRDLTSGTWRIRVTGVNDTSDIRLDIPNVVITDKQIVTLVLTQSGAGGLLLNGTLLVQGGAATTTRNTKARVRLAAGVSNNGNVSVTFNGTPLFSNYRSPRVAGTGAYAPVEGGTGTLVVTVNGTAVSSTTQTFVAGTDYTVLAYGPDTAPRVTVLTDDNRLPDTSSLTKLRLVNGLPGADSLLLTLDGKLYNPLTDIGPGVASAYVTPTSAPTRTIEVSNGDVIYTAGGPNNTAVLLQPLTVYTVFLLGGSTSPRGFLVTDR